jgi:hypothetical protein
LFTAVAAVFVEVAKTRTLRDIKLAADAMPTDILYYRQTVSSVRSSGPPEGERSHKRREAIELKMNFRIWTTLIWVEL